jgi:hypothetical protein
MKLKKINFFFLAPFLVLFLSIFIRLENLGGHFTQVDETGISELILYPKDLTEIDRDFSEERIEDQSPLIFNLYQYSEERNYTEHFLEFGNEFYQFFVVSITQTFAPIQFIATRFLISDEMSYRDILYWSRVPSLIFSILSLLLIFLFYERLQSKQRKNYKILAIALMGLSIEHIIFSQQAISYAIGIFAAMMLNILLLKYTQKVYLSYKDSIWLGFIIAFLVFCQYQILFFIPAFIFTLVFYQAKNFDLIKNKILKLIPAGISFTLLFLPLYIVFLRRYDDAGLNYNTGPNNEFVFNISGNELVVEKISYFFDFFINNWIEVFRSMTSFVPIESEWFLPFSIILLVMFILGTYSFLRKDGFCRQIGIFFFCIIMTWFILVIIGKIALSPTRHSLILLPLFVITICEGCFYICKIIYANMNARINLHLFTPLILSLFICIIFITSYHEEKLQRIDVFNENELTRIIEDNKIETIILFGCSYQPLLMPKINKNYPVYYGCANYRKSNNIAKQTKPSLNKVAFIAPGNEINIMQFEKLIEQPNQGEKINFNNYDLKYSLIKSSPTQMEYSNKVISQTNGLSIFIYEKNIAELIN